MFTAEPKTHAGWALAGLLVAALVLFIAGCGGGAALPAAAQPGTNPNGWYYPNLLPLGSPIPAMPTDLTGAPAHTASAILDYPGAVFLSASGGTVDGDDLILQSTPDEVAWAMYKAGGLTGLKVDGFGVETVPGDLETQYSVGLSNFSDGHWQYFITTSLPEASIDLTENTKRLTSRLGNLYYIVVVSGGKSLRMKAGHVFTADGQDGWTPGQGNGIFVSKGLPDKIRIEWGAIDGANHYELWRKLDDGSHGASMEGGADGFGLITSTEGTSYNDTDVLAGKVYVYKVRGANAAGPGGFSGTERGYMGTPPSGGDGEGIEAHGLIGLLDQERLGLDGSFNFRLTADTQWFRLDGSIGSREDFKVGDNVVVQGVKSGDMLTALRVKLLPPPAGDDPAEVDAKGIITHLSSDRITLDNGFSFFINADTLWFLRSGEQGEKADFAEGDPVEVHGRKIGDVLTAIKVRMDEGEHGTGGGGGAGDQFRKEGTIASREAGLLNFTDGETINYTSDTKWFDAAGNPADLLQFFTGVKVVAEGIMDGSVRKALVVRIVPGGEGHLEEVNGVISSREGGRIRLGDLYSFSWGMTTKWFLADGSPSNSDAFGVGDEIHVVYETNGDNKLAVKVVMIHDISI
jgi:hypothetical protein